MFWAFVVAYVLFSLGLSVNVSLACLTIVPIALLHCLWASDAKIGVTGLRSLINLPFIWIGFRA